MKKIIFVFTKVLIGFIVVLGGLYFVLFFSNKGDFKVAKTVVQDSTIPHIDFDDVSLHVETFGNDTSQVVVVVHGGMGGFKNLLALKGLSDNFFVVFYDQRGSGLSARVPADELTIENAIKDLDAIISHFGNGNKINIIAHSWGAMLASAYLGKYPDTIHKIILAEPGPLMPKIAKSKKSHEPQLTLSWELIKHVVKCYFQSLHVEEIDEWARSDYFFEAFLSDSTIKNHPFEKYFCNGRIRNEAFKSERYSFLSTLDIMEKQARNDQRIMNFTIGTDNFESKILFLTGECSLLGSEFQEQQMRLFKNTELAIIPEVGHFMFEEQPNACIEVVQKFFNE